jgi:3-oxoacyl-(acyl-carrier-protein) synthase
MSQHAYELLHRSNFEAVDRPRYEQVVEVAAAEAGITIDDVLAVAHDRALWAACTSTIFRANLRGILNKRVEISKSLDYREISEVRVEPSSPHTHKVVLNGENRQRLAQINFSAAGPSRTVEGAYRDCQTFAEAIKSAWSQAR